MYSSRWEVGTNLKLIVCAGIHTVQDPITAVAKSFLIFFWISSTDFPSVSPRYVKNITPKIGFQIVFRWRFQGRGPQAGKHGKGPQDEVKEKVTPERRWHTMIDIGKTKSLCSLSTFLFSCEQGNHGRSRAVRVVEM